MSSRHQTADETVSTTLTREEIYSLFRGFLRYPSVLREAIRVHMDEARFRHSEHALHVLFAGMRELFGQYGAVTEDMLATWVQARAEDPEQPVGLSEADVLFLFGEAEGEGFIAEACRAPLPDAAGQAAERRFLEDTLKRFMRVRMIKPDMQHALNPYGDEAVPERLQAMLARWSTIVRDVDHIGDPVTNSARMPDIGTPIQLLPPALPTTIPWIDTYIGGFRPGDTIGILAPYGGGKTTALTVAAVRMAELYHTQNIRKLAVFIGYEDGAERMNPLFWSAAAQIERSMFVASETGSFWGQMSDQHNLKDYDRQLSSNRNGQILLGETERWNLAKTWFNSHFAFLDFSGNAQTGGRGSGGVEEIKMALERLAEETGFEIGFVCVDYAGLMVERYLAAEGSVVSRSEMQAIIRPIKQLPDDLRTKIAVPMNATVFLAHQFAPGEVQRMRPYQYISHLEAAGSKSFAENLHSCLCINSRDNSTGVSTINWSKIRTGNPITRYGLVRMDDHVADIHLVNDQYQVSSEGRAIVRRGDVRPGPLSPGAAEEAVRPSGRRIQPLNRGLQVDNFMSGTE